MATTLFVRTLAAADAAKIFEEGRKAEHAGQMVQAYLLYSQAASLDPLNPFYRLKSEAVKSRAALESPPKPPDADAKPETTAADPASTFDPLNASDRSAERTPKPPPELKGAPELKDFDLHADAKSLWQQVARAFGLEAVFDTDYESGPPLTFRLDQTGYRQALRAAEAATGSFVVPISRRLFLVVKDTDQKRKEREPTVAVTVAVPQATTTQELTEIGQAVRQLFTLEHMGWDQGLNLVIMRDRISRVVPAVRVFNELLHHRPQIDIEMELLEVDRTSSLAYGVDLPMTFPITYLGTFWHSPVPSIVAKMATFGGGQSLFGIAIADAALLANMSRSFTRTLVRSEIRAVDGTPATMHVGEKFPVLTAGYYGPASSSQGGTVYLPPPSFTFEDLGINLKVTPRIHGMDEVTLDLETEFKVLTGQTNNGIPIITSRHLSSKIRLREGEWGVVAGLLTSSEARTISGIAGLSSIPVLGRLFQQNNKDENTSQVLLIIKPTLLNLPPDEFVTPTIWTGSELRPVMPL
ncbi:MAG: type II and III secretion system protein [Acidobacteriia bacterium]|nr:type II and III secretion system protein [Terriglobia bacterium]